MADIKPDIQAIFCEALERTSPTDLAQYLDAACGADSTLRTQVEELLNSNRAAGRFLGGSSPSRSITVEQPSSEALGTAIGPYKLLQQIGEGGMGTVYMAEQTEPVQRKVALKLIKPGMDSRQVISRFEAERQALALMDHPNIAKVLDAGTFGEKDEGGRMKDETSTSSFRVHPSSFAGGLPYFVMELVKGVPITKYCDEHHLTPRERLELFIPVCQAVQHAHQKGVIHRDLKPSNVLVALYDGRPVPKVIDFGVAKATGQKLTDRTMYTEFGAIVGTLEYMSPEQAESNQLDIDTRSDIYSLGVLLYELLTGTTPFEKKRLKDAALLEILRIIREDEPPKPSTRLSTTDELPSISANRGLEPNKLSALVRGELDWIVMKALEKDRNRRYETANGFALDIQRYLADEPVAACPPSAVYRLRKFARRNKGALTIGSAVTLAFLVVVGSLGWMLRDRTAREEEFAHQRAAREQEFDRERKARDQEIARKRQESETALNREVDRAMEEADRLGKQEKWPEAHDAVERAEKLLASAGRSDRPPHLVSLRRDLTMAQRLEDIYRNPQRDPTRGAPSETIELVPGDLDHDRQRDPAIALVTAPLPIRGGLPGRPKAVEDSAEEEIFAGREQDARFAVAFQDFGIDIDMLECADAAARIDGTNIAPALVKALDDWAAMRRRARGEVDAWRKLVEIARSADRDRWRNKFRGALLARDRQALEKLATEVSPRNSPPATLLLLAEALKQLGAMEKAIDLLRQSQRQYPDDLWLNDALARASVDACQPPRFADAIRFYAVASALRPRSARWREALAGSLVNTAATEEGIAEFSRALELQPDNLDVWHRRGLLQLKAGKWDEAVAGFAEPLDREPANAREWQLRGDRFVHLGLWQEAAADYARAYDLQEPVDALGCYQVAVIGLYTGDIDAYRKISQRIIERFVDSADPYNAFLIVFTGAIDSQPAVEPARLVALAERAVAAANYAWHLACLGLANYRAGEYDRAVASLQKSQAINAGWNPPWGYSVLAMAQHQLGNLDEASAALDKARSTRDERVEAMLAGEIGFVPGLWWDILHAELLCREARSLIDGSARPDDPRLLVLRARGLEAVGRADEARAELARAFALQPEDLRIRVLALPHASRTESYAQALADLRTFLREHPNQPDGSRLALARAHLQWGARQWFAGHRPDAEAALDQVIEVAPQSAQVLLERGNFWLSVNDAARAIDDFSKALEQTEDAGSKSVAYQQRGFAHSSLGQHVEARDDWQQALVLAPQNALAHNNLAWLLATSPEAALRDPRRAVELAAKAVELGPKQGTFWNTLGAAHYYAGDWAAAIEALNKSMALRQGGDGFDWFFLAMAEWKRWNNDKARRWYDKAAAWRAQNARDNEELQRIDAEAKEVLDVKKSEDGR